LEFPTLDEANVKGRIVILRIDINSPIDSKTGEISDDTRIRECAPTISELVHKGARIVLLAHQGRPGDADFTTLEKHAARLSHVLGMRVEYIDDIFGPSARSAIKTMRPCEILLLENIRFCAEESLSKGDLVNTHLVRKLAALADIYVNDAFGAIHRSSPSLVGFGHVLPTFAGRLMEHELRGLSKALSPERPCVYVLGGAKVDDSLVITENVLSKNLANQVLTGGLVGQTFLAASGLNLGDVNLRVLHSILDKAVGYEQLLTKAKGLLAKYGSKIKMPLDVVVDDDGRAVEVQLEQLPVDRMMSDIGSKTVVEYSRIIEGAKTIVANGPLGRFENANFARGSFEVLKAMARSPAFTIVGGGHIVAAANAAGVTSKIKHVSTGGGACISFLSGEKLPVVEMLMHAKRGALT